jgi:hypothetical protein
MPDPLTEQEQKCQKIVEDQMCKPCKARTIGADCQFSLCTQATCDEFQEWVAMVKMAKREAFTDAANEVHPFDEARRKFVRMATDLI